MKYARLGIQLAIILALTLGYWKFIQRGIVPPPAAFTAFFEDSRDFDQEQFHILPDYEGFLNSEQSLAVIIDSSQKDVNEISILVEKSKQRLTVYHSGKPVKSYPVVFGENPQGDKLQQGDQKTPEGLFKIRDLYPHETWSKFLWLDYPTTTSWKKHLKAKQQGNISWWDGIGGEIGIHGVPVNGDALIDQGINWTLGCVSLKNSDVDEIYPVVKVGTIVEIVP